MERSDTERSDMGRSDVGCSDMGCSLAHAACVQVRASSMSDSFSLSVLDLRAQTRASSAYCWKSLVSDMTRSLSSLRLPAPPFLWTLRQGNWGSLFKTAHPVRPERNNGGQLPA